MGLISQLALLPVAPLRFTGWVADKVAQEVEREEFSQGAGVRKLEEIQQARERGEISEEEAAELEGRIIEQQINTPTLSKRGEGLNNG